MNEQLKNYIQEALKAGQAKEDIRRSLLEAGWQETDVAKALGEFESAVPRQEFIASTIPVEKPSSAKRFFDSLKTRFKSQKTYYVLGGLVLVILVSLFLYQKIFLKEELSEFELTPQIADAAGIKPETSFILKSSADLNATVVQRYLKFEPDIEYKIRKIGSGSSIFEITPVNALSENVVYSITIAKGPIAARTYSWAYQVKAPFQIIASLPRDKATFVPTNTGIEITFNRENLVNPQSSFEISPSVRGRFEVHRNVLVFVPLEELAPRTLYTIKIKSGIRAQGSDDTLTEDAEIKFETSERYTGVPRPFFDFSKRFWEFKPDNEATFQVSYSNLQTNTIPLTIYKLDNINEFVETYKNTITAESGWARYHAYNPVNLPSDKKIFESNVPLEEQANVRFVRIPQKLGEGFYIAETTINNERKQVWFQITPLASFSAISSTKTLLWFKDLQNGANIANAEVSFEGKNVGRSNSDGVAMFDTPRQLIRERGESYWYSAPPTYFYIVNSGGRQLAIPTENEYGSFSKVNPPDSWWNYFSTDKTVYLPSDKVYFWGIVKQRNGTDVKGEKITVQLTNPFWEGTSQDDITVYGKTDTVISDFYTLTGNIAFSDLKPGLYQLSVKRGDEIIISETINVKTYIKPAYRLTLTPDKNAVFAEDTIIYKVKAEFFEGTPVANLKLKYNGYLNRQISGEVQLNQNGEGSFSIKTDYQETQYGYWPRYLGLTVSPAVAEEGEITANTSVLVFGPRIDLRSEQTITERTNHFNLNLRNIVLDKIQRGDPWWVSDNYLGNPVSGWNITADVTEIIYRQEQTGTGYDVINKTTYPIYRYFTEERPVRQDTLTTDGAGNARYEWTAEENKTYRVTFAARDAAGRLVKRQHYVYGGSFSYFGFYDARGAVLKNLDEGKNKYKLGDAMRLQMQNIGGNALEPGSGRFIFVRMVNGISSYQITDSPNYNDTFKDSYIPNVQIMGVWFTGLRFSNSYSANLPFDSDEHRLNVEVTKDKERYRPRDKVNLVIRVTDKNGNPKQAEVNIAGIDEAVFSLNPIEKDITNLLYRNVFSSVAVRSSHLTPLESGAEGGGCFAPGTMVLTPKGEKAIENLRVGDEILTRKSETSSKLVKTKIKQIGSYLVDGYIVVNNKLRLTPNHTLFVNGSWKRVGEIEVGDVLTIQNGKPEKVASLSFVQEWGLVYNIELENYHTYFANGIYVHNEEKGGGIERADFRDLAIYESVHTDSSGRAQVSFDVPDNLTSWRITAQAITKDLFAGKIVDFVPVGLPFFVESTLNRTYLAGDNLTLRARVSGTANVQNNITYTVESETLPFGKIERTGENVIEIPLGQLPAGKHKIKISAKSGNYSDTIVRDLNVLTSYFSQNTSEFYELSPNLTNIQGAAKGYTTLSFMSYERGRFYNALRRLSWQAGPRLDQKFAGVFAKSYLNRFFGETNELGDTDALSYQYQGGATLLPYSDVDLELSAKFANLIQGEPITADPDGLKRYFYTSLTDRKADLSRISAALYGLSVFKEPVLVTIQNIKNDRNLTLKDKIYIALALDNLGAKEEARAYYKAEIKPNLTSREPYTFVNRLQNQDENIIATVLLAGLTASLSEPEADGLGSYALENYPKDTLKNFEMLLYMRSALPLLKGGDVGFSYQTGQKSGSKTLKNNEVFRLELSREELAAVKFSNITGRIGLVSTFEKESTPTEARKDMSINVSRTYSVDGKQTIQFKEGDLVRIDLAPTFAPGSLEGSYQVVDYLPSGLRAVTNIQTAPFRQDGQYPRFPSSIEDQKITFVVWKSFPRPFFYYARVVSKGDYKAEPALIQSLRSAESSNISNEANIIIR